MQPRVTYRQAAGDANLLGSVLNHEHYRVWNVIFLAFLGEPLTPAERLIFQQFTAREREPGRRGEELIVVKGRRAGGSSATGKLLIPYLAGLCEHPSLVRGERGILLCIAPDQAQAAITLDYCHASFEQSPILRQLIKSRSADSLLLTNNISIETRWSNFRRLRGPTYVAVICDESAFWFDADSGSANSDAEIVTACRPGLASTGGPLIMISSPYARRGLLWEMFDRHYGAAGDPLIVVARGTSRAFNKTLPQSVVDRAIARDPAAAAAEWLATFRTDLEAFVSLEAVRACVSAGSYERRPQPFVSYSAFVDPSGGSVDSMALAIGHLDHARQTVVLDCLREAKPPFSPEAVVEQFSKTLGDYALDHVIGDRYAGAWPVEQFSKFGIRYEQSARPKSDLYADVLPLINSGRIDLLDGQPKLIAQLTSLERRTSRGGRDSIDHPPGQHDDLCNCLAGLAGINGQFGKFDSSFSFVDGNEGDDPHGFTSFRRARFAQFLRANGIPL
jgi:hypothetical protein